jgi:hypothetical protein
MGSVSGTALAVNGAESIIIVERIAETRVFAVWKRL